MSPTWTKSAPTQAPFPTNRPVPILPPEPDCHPADLLDRADLVVNEWWLIYTKSRQEKQLMRQLRELDVPHYGPQIVQRRRSPAGRIRTTYAPLFNNYVFLCGDDQARYQAVCTGRVQKATPISDVPKFVSDLKQIRDLINMGVPLTLESRLEAGQHVRVRSGAFAGYEGTILRREQETRLLVSVHFMEQGVSVKLEDCQLELIG
ncbi:MAG: KOW motif-containing protein [Pirellulales bacterium]|nr:KOW motif-containing protein [Pirellulales bacterium]